MIQDIGIGHSIISSKGCHNVYFMRHAIEFIFAKIIKGMA